MARNPVQAKRIIEEEHRSLAAVLHGMLYVIREIRYVRIKPDFVLLEAMVHYIDTFLEQFHHPKEDAYLFKLLGSRYPGAAPLLDRLKQQHESGAVKLREDVLVAGGERIAIAAFRRLPGLLLAHGGGRVVTRILARFATTGTAKVAARVVPLGVGVAVGAGFDWVAVTGLGRAAMKYYGPGGPGARPLLLAPKDPADVELGS